MMIEASNVTVGYKRGLRRKKILALDDFSLRVEPGDFFALLGPNGAGKSTAMYCFLGLIQPDRGSIRVLGEKPRMGSPQFERIAYLPEEPHYHLYLTVEEAVRYYGSLYRAEIPEFRVGEVLEQVGLSEFSDLRLSRCSKGMKQKAGIAACLLKECDLLFMDEPTRGLDPIATKEFRDILVGMNRRGTTVVINSHILSEVEIVSNHVAIMDRGRVLVQDELKSLMRYELERYCVEFDASETLPEFLSVESCAGGMVKGSIPIEKLPEFLNFTREMSLMVYECSLKRMSLEEIFLDVLEGGGNASSASQ